MLRQANRKDDLLCTTIFVFPILMPSLTGQKLFTVFHKDRVKYTFASVYPPAALKMMNEYVKLFKEALNEDSPV